MRRLTEIEEGVSLRFLVAVDQDLFGPALPRRPACQRVLPAIPIAREVSEGTVRLRDGGVVLPDPSAQFRDQPFAQGCRSSQRRGRIGILAVQVSADLDRKDGRVIQYVAPIFSLKPSVIVGYRRAVNLEHVGPSRR